MPTVTQVNDLKINKLTKAQYDAAVQAGTIGENEISIITDLDATPQVDSLPTADASQEGKIYQYIGATDANYTNGYFYKCVSDGAATPTYSWENIEVQPAGDSLPDQTGQAGKFLTTDGTDASWSDKPLVNTATGTQALTIIGNANNSNNAINIGYNSTIDNGTNGIAIGAYAKTIRGQRNIAIGYNASASCADMGSSMAIGSDAKTTALWYPTAIGNGSEAAGDYSLCVGQSAKCSSSASHAIQLGSGQNTESNTFKVAIGNSQGGFTNYKVLDSDGTIPEARLADTTNAQQGDVLTLDANGNAVWQAGGSGGGVPTLTWYTISTAGTTLTIADTSSAQLVKVYKNGLLLQPTEDYMISGTTLTTVSAMVVGDKITTEVF